MLAPGNRHQQIEYMLSHCSDFTEKLSEWEANFIESVDAQFERKGDLSEKQVEIIEKIYCGLP